MGWVRSTRRSDTSAVGSDGDRVRAPVPAFEPAYHPGCGPVNPAGAAVEVLSHGFFGPGGVGGGGGGGVRGQPLLAPDLRYSIQGVSGSPSALVTVTTGQFAK